MSQNAIAWHNRLGYPTATALRRPTDVSGSVAVPAIKCSAVAQW